MALQFIANQRIELYKDVQRLRQAYLEALVLTICFPFHVWCLLLIVGSAAWEHLSRVCPNPFRRYVTPFGHPSYAVRNGRAKADAATTSPAGRGMQIASRATAAARDHFPHPRVVGLERPRCSRSARRPHRILLELHARALDLDGDGPATLARGTLGQPPKRPSIVRKHRPGEPRPGSQKCANAHHRHVL